MLILILHEIRIFIIESTPLYTDNLKINVVLKWGHKLSEEKN